MPWEPLETLLRELKSTDSHGHYNGSLDAVRKALGITTSNISAQPLSRSKNPSMNYKLSEARKSWVVKFSPEDKQDDSWYDVWEEDEILQGHRRAPASGPRIPSPASLYRCTEAERRVVGTKFIFMEFVEGRSFKNANSIPEEDRHKAFNSVARALAKNVHFYHWMYTGSEVYAEHTDSSTFWATQVASWKRNYDAATAPGCELDGLFSEMSIAEKPSHSNTELIHGDMNISKVIFADDDEYNVKVFVDWKGSVNGDPMVDVAYLCLTFTIPGDYGPQFRALNNHPLLLAPAHNMEKQVLDAYTYSQGYFPFKQEVLQYAKAVSCLRMLSIIKAARADNFVGHESGEYEDNTDHTQLVMSWLATAGKSFYDQSVQLRAN